MKNGVGNMEIEQTMTVDYEDIASVFSYEMLNPYAIRTVFLTSRCSQPLSPWLTMSGLSVRNSIFRLSPSDNSRGGHIRRSSCMPTKGMSRFY